MRERINRLAKGIVDTEIPQLGLSAEVIDETIKTNTKIKKELYLYSENGLNIKGLVYSSNIRVKVLNNAFGGLRNHIGYEVDSTYLMNGDVIEGKLYLVTNCGEKEIPYKFHIDLASSGKTLGDFNTAEDFAKIAEHDMDTALRLLEYQDFGEAPFMQDLHARAVYHGLKGHGSRQNELEEFLVALKVKEPVTLTFDREEKLYMDLTEEKTDCIVIQKNTWGYVYIEAVTDCDFIQLSKRMITQDDFRNDICEFEYELRPQMLHGGRNFGKIFLSTSSTEAVIRIEVRCRGSYPGEDRKIYRERFVEYLKRRQEYESGTYEPSLLLNKMQKELDIMSTTQENAKTMLTSLLQAELYILSGREEKACLILDENRDQVLENRQENRGLYCFYQYLYLLVSGNVEEQREALARLIRRYHSEKETDFYLYMLLLRVDSSLMENPGALYNSLKNQYLNGCHSPFLYLEACRLFTNVPELLRTLDTFELHAIYCGAKRGLIEESLALKIAGLAMNVRNYRRLYCRLLILLYQTYERTEFLSAICCMLIKGNCRGTRFFDWYEEGLSAGISLTRLYEYYLFSLPEDYDRLLPKEVLLYFSYDNELDRHSKSVLYANILNYMDKENPLYHSYERSIEKYAMEQMFETRIDSRLAVIYKNIIYKDIIDQPIARVLPSILRSSRITCGDPLMKYVVVCHEELVKEDAYLLKGGAAYVPIYSEHEIIMFQDSYGNRYLNVDYTSEAALDEPELLEKCFEMFPDHPMLSLNECWQILDKQQMDEEDVSALEYAMETMELQPVFQKRLLSRVIAYYKKLILENDDLSRRADSSYLICLDKHKLDRDERAGICETLISQNYFTESYDMIREFGLEGIQTKRLLKLCAKMVLQKLFDEDDLLLHIAYRVFREGMNDSVILDYLCEHFNGTVDQMYRVLMQAVCDHVETYDLEERLVAQMLFTNNTGRIDQVFDLYATRKRTSESIVKAYFTVKCVEYFLDGKVPKDRVFEYLESAVHNSVEKDKVPDIYLLALSKYYSTLPALEDDQKELCQTVVNILLGAGMLFQYFKTLSKFISIPGDIMDKEMIEYHGSREKKPYLQVRILPEEEEYHPEEMRQIYKGIYLKEKVLFEGEIMEYRIFEEEEDHQILKDEGSISCQESYSKAEKNRFFCLNEMSLSMSVKDEENLKEKMEEYLIRNAAVEELFPLA